jgi:hypothetical protein
MWKRSRARYPRGSAGTSGGATLNKRVRPNRVRFSGLFVAAFLLAIPVGHVDAADTFTPALSFPATDERAEFTVDIGRDVILHVRRAIDAQGRHFGWDLAAADRRLENSPNFFYECLCGHGPRPHDLYAWHFAEAYYPAERTLPIYGYPFEVRVQCLDCQVRGNEGTDVRFTSGTVTIGWRRLPTSYPRQRRISDIVREQR